MRRGEVWTVDFGLPSGPEEAGQRPAIIFQDDPVTNSLPTVLVVPLTSHPRRLVIPWTVRVDAGEGGLTKDLAAHSHQLQVRGKMRLLARLGKLPDATMKLIETKVLEAIGL
jgi:mRNA interferase MazF